MSFERVSRLFNGYLAFAETWECDGSAPHGQQAEGRQPDCKDQSYQNMRVGRLKFISFLFLGARKHNFSTIFSVIDETFATQHCAAVSLA